jgi:hypothetical protein
MIMGYFDTFKGIIYAESKQRFYRTIPNNHVWPQPLEGTFEPDGCYLRVWLTDMYLAHKRELWETHSPAVHLTCRFQYAGTVQELPLIIGPGQSDELKNALDRAVNLNYPLFGLVPYRGGDVELLLALIATEVSDYGDKLLDVLGSLSQLTGHGELKTLLPLLQPLKSGVEGFFGMGDHKVRLGIHDTFAYGPGAPSPLKPGYRVVMDITDGGIDPKSLWVKEGRLHHGPTLDDAEPFEGADYFLFNVEKADVRGDDLPSVREAWMDAMTKVAKSSDQEVDLAVAAYKAIVLTSPDLIWSDQEARILALLDRIKKIRTMKDRKIETAPKVDFSLKAALDVAPDRLFAQAGKMSRQNLVEMNWR